MSKQIWNKESKRGTCQNGKIFVPTVITDKIKKLPAYAYYILHANDLKLWIDDYNWYLCESTGTKNNKNSSNCNLEWEKLMNALRKPFYEIIKKKKQQLNFLTYFNIFHENSIKTFLK